MPPLPESPRIACAPDHHSVELHGKAKRGTMQNVGISFRGLRAMARNQQFGVELTSTFLGTEED